MPTESKPMEQTGGTECDHTVGIDWFGRMLIFSFGPAPKDGDSVTWLAFCPDCGARLLPEGPFKPKTCVCGASIKEGEFYAQFPDGTQQFLCLHCCTKACEVANNRPLLQEAPNSTTPQGF